ncbi:MAG: hypothetical protein KatS3mg125_0232 [Lysobacterales bacterium]|nr:MAG: hypothetical protein KatS3mg125_0232 [Xanthomonadales bacterium]
MSLKLHFELDEQDIAHLRGLLAAAAAARGQLAEPEILAAARSNLADARAANPPHFIVERLDRLERMIAMVGDEGFALPEPERGHVLAAITYFADPKDLIPDSVPVFGFLDDAVMIELIARELRHELEAYEDFCRYREIEARRRGVDPAQIGRADWLETRRKELHLRMRRRRKAERERLQASGRGLRMRLW